jgi:hypothetical protein
MKVTSTMMFISILERIIGLFYFENLTTPQFQAHFDEMKFVSLGKKKPLISFTPCSYYTMQTFLNFLSCIIIWKRRWKIDLKRLWICKSRMWSLIYCQLFISCNNHFLMMQLSYLLIKLFFLIYLFIVIFQPNYLRSLWWMENHGKWNKQVKMVVHKRCHDKSTSNSCIPWFFDFF